LFDVEAMTRKAQEDERRWRELQTKWERHDMEIKLAIEAAMLQHAFAVGSMWAAALRPAYQEGV
jgi:hypothetical protein